MNSLDQKSALASRAVWGGLIAFIAGALPLFSVATGVTIGTEDSQSLVTGLEALGATVGGILAVLGRIWATRPIA